MICTVCLCPSMSISGLFLRRHFSRASEIHLEALDPLGKSHASRMIMHDHAWSWSDLHGEWLGWHRSKPQAEIVGHRLGVQLFNLKRCDSAVTWCDIVGSDPSRTTDQLTTDPLQLSYILIISYLFSNSVWGCGNCFKCLHPGPWKIL